MPILIFTRLCWIILQHSWTMLYSTNSVVTFFSSIFCISLSNMVRTHKKSCIPFYFRSLKSLLLRLDKFELVFFHLLIYTIEHICMLISTDHGYLRDHLGLWNIIFRIRKLWEPFLWLGFQNAYCRISFEFKWLHVNISENKHLQIWCEPHISRPVSS